MEDSLGARVRRIREQLQVSRPALAQIVGVTPQWLGQIENEQKKASLRLVRALEAWLADTATKARRTSTRRSPQPPPSMAAEWAMAIVRLVRASARQNWHARIDAIRANPGIAGAGVGRHSAALRPLHAEIEPGIVSAHDIVQLIRAAIVDKSAAGRPISMLFQSHSPFDSAEKKQSFVDIVILSACNNARINYAAVESADWVASSFESSHFALNLQAAIAATVTETFLQVPASARRDRGDRPVSYGSCHLGSTELSATGADARPHRETIVGVNVISVPERGIFVSLPAATIHQPDASFCALPHTSKHASVAFEKFLEHRSRHIIVYTQAHDAEFWRKYKDIEDVDAPSRLVQKFFSSLTRPFDYFNQEGAWFKARLAQADNDIDEALKMAADWHERTTRIRERVMNGTSYRQICDLVTLNRWIETGEHPDSHSESTHDVEARLARLEEVRAILAEPGSKLELAIVDEFDELIYGSAGNNAPALNWIVVGREYSMVEAACDSDPRLREIRLVLRGNAVATAFQEWFDRIWNDLDPDAYDRQKNLDRIENWIAGLRRERDAASGDEMQGDGATDQVSS